MVVETERLAGKGGEVVVVIGVVDFEGIELGMKEVNGVEMKSGDAADNRAVEARKGRVSVVKQLMVTSVLSDNEQRETLLVSSLLTTQPVSHLRFLHPYFFPTHSKFGL